MSRTHLTRLCAETIRLINRARVLRIPSIYLRKSAFLKRTGLLSGKTLVVLSFIPTVHAISFGRKKPTENMATSDPTEKSKDQEIIDDADQMYSGNETLKLYDFLIQFKDSTNDEILWRLCRASVDKGKMSNSKEDRKACMYEAFEYIKKAVAINDNNYSCHRWYGIMLDYVGEYEGTKQRINNAYKVKEHFLKAIELNPKDVTSLHSLGYWCFLFADLPWYQQKIAAALFSTPPTSTYEEALTFFQKAEDMEPNFYSMNLLMLGKTYARLKNYKLALLYLTKARDYPVKTPDDEKAHKESLDLLKSIGIKDLGDS